MGDASSATQPGLRRAEAGYFPVEVLDSYGKLGSKIPGHPDMHKLPGIKANAGALGHGLSISTGTALGLRLSGGRARVFAILIPVAKLGIPHTYATSGPYPELLAHYGLDAAGIAARVRDETRR